MLQHTTASAQVKKEDPAWRHCKRVLAGNSIKLICNYYKEVKNGGVTRIKQHHSGGTYRKTSTCLLCPPDVRLEMNEYLLKIAAMKNQTVRHESEGQTAGDESDSSLAVCFFIITILSYDPNGCCRRHRENLGVDTMEETWSCIPNLLIWMIMKRMRFIDNLHLSAVCKHWLNAFHNFPKEQIPTMSCSNFPWLMITKDHRGSEREFFSPWTKTKFSVDLPEFSKTFAVQSKYGWVLLLTCHCCEQVPRVFLLNPFTRVKLEMPRPPLFLYLSAISMLDGTPNCVALVRRRLAIAYPGDDAWKIFTIPLEAFQCIVHMFFVDRYLYLIDNYGRALRFNTIDFTMTDGFMGVKVNQFGTTEKDTYFLQCNKEIIRVCSTTSTGRGRFCMNCFEEAAWEALDDDEIRGKSWFLSNCGAKFASAAEGTAVERVHFLSKYSRRASYCLFSCDLNSPGKDAHSYFGNLSKKSTVWINMG